MLAIGRKFWIKLEEEKIAIILIKVQMKNFLNRKLTFFWFFFDGKRCQNWVVFYKNN